MNLIRDDRGQGTVEAAVVTPVLFLIMLMLLQPGIVLYDRLVMGNAAAEGCRLLATATDDMAGSCEAFIRHRLAAVPQHDCFHVHSGYCSWEIELDGGETNQTASVRIRNELRPLPLFDAGAKLLGLVNANGNLEIEEHVELQVQPDWVASSELGMNPASWVDAWSS